MRQLNVAICDNDDIEVNFLKKSIEKLCMEQQITVEIVAKNSMGNFCHCIQEHKIDIIFIEVNINGESGVEVAEQIRKCDENIIIIFITKTKGYGFKAYELKAIDYIIKPLTEKRILDTMQKVFREIEVRALLKKRSSNENTSILILKNKSQVITLNHDEILYIEKIDKFLKITCTERIVQYRSSLNKILEKLNSEIFIRCHQGYIVNFNKVDFCRENKLFIKNTDASVPVSRANKNKVLEVIEKMR